MTKIIAVDFDGVLCKDRFPKIGEANEEIISTLQTIQVIYESVLILWTCRTGNRLKEAVEWCKVKGLNFDYVNENAPHLIKQYGSDTRKVSADYIIDDKSVYGSEEERTVQIEQFVNQIYYELTEANKK